MKESQAYYIFNRRDWKEINTIHFDIDISEEDIERVLSLNDSLNIRDVNEVYLPILYILSVYIRHYKERQQEVQMKIAGQTTRMPYIIGVSGSVAVGKSTFSRLLKELLDQIYKGKKVQMITTDGFLYPNNTLKEKNLMKRKGFPESYDMPKLIDFLEDVKNRVPYIQVPKYSHQEYDILSDEYHIIDQPDILIVEGINVLQLPATEKIYASDFFDFSFYIDAEAKNIEKWYLQRYSLILDLASEDENDYFHEMSKKTPKEGHDFGKHVWQTVNLPNLYNYILPTRSRADMIIHKGYNHHIDQILLRKY